MLLAIFAAAMAAPHRQLGFRRLASAHAVLVAGLVGSAAFAGTDTAVATAAQLLLCLGLVEGATLIGWRLTQLPKSQALEFMLVSPVRPAGFFLAEALVGVGRFALVGLGGVPVLGLMVFAGLAEWADLLPLALLPFVWGTVVGLGLTAFVYEPVKVRRAGELLGLLGVLLYLVVGVLAGEHLRDWLLALPSWLGEFIFDGVLAMHHGNPFGVVRYWFDPFRSQAVAWERFLTLNLVGAALAGLFLWRGAARLHGHFQDRHYRPLDSSRPSQLEKIGDRPLSWWAVRRVMEYSGRVNLWLANGFALAYAAYILAGDAWPAWMGKLVFQMFEGWGGAPLVSTALAVLAAVPAAYQFGLWDATPQDRCRRLELLLLTDLTGRDYLHASWAAAWKRGRGYLLGAGALVFALAWSGRVPVADALAAVVGAVAFWAFAFALGFRGFSTGHQTNGVASLLTLGMPMLLWLLLRAGLNDLAAFVPTAAVYLPTAAGVSWTWLAGVVVMAGVAAYFLRRGVVGCETDLRRWYDANQGTRST